MRREGGREGGREREQRKKKQEDQAHHEASKMRCWRGTRARKNDL